MEWQSVDLVALDFYRRNKPNKVVTALGYPWYRLWLKEMGYEFDAILEYKGQPTSIEVWQNDDTEEECRVYKIGIVRAIPGELGR